MDAEIDKSPHHGIIEGGRTAGRTKRFLSESASGYGQEMADKLVAAIAAIAVIALFFVLDACVKAAKAERTESATAPICLYRG